MARLTRLALILAMMTVASRPAAPRIIGSAAGHGDEISPAIVENYGHLTVMRLRGTPYEMGYQHGVAKRTALWQLLDDAVYNRVILESGESQGILMAHARQLERALPLDIQRELRGIADGSGLSYQDILLLNLVLNRLLAVPSTLTSELSSLPMLDLKALAFAAWPPATRQDVVPDDTLLGYRLEASDHADLLRRHLAVAIYQPIIGQTYATLTWSGQVGAWCGLNLAGLAVCATPAVGGDASHQELPPAILTRRLLARAQDGEQALREAIRHDFLALFRLVIADGQHQTATAIDFGTHRYEIVESQTGEVIADADRPLLAALLGQNVGWLNRNKVLAALASRWTPSEGRPGICGESTLINALLAPGSSELWVGLGLWPASCRRYLHLDLND